MAKFKGARLKVSLEDRDHQWMYEKGDFYAYHALKKELGKKKHDVLHDQQMINDLVMKAQSGCEASRTRLLEINLRFIFISAKKFVTYENNILSFCDLVSEGSIGLLKSIERFTFRNVKFLSYATWYISAHMFDAIRKSTVALHVPYEQKNRYGRGHYLEDIRYHQDASDEETLGGTYHPSYSTTSNNAERLLEYEDFLTEVKRVCYTLTPRESDVVEFYFHFANTTFPLGLSEIGELFDLGGERIRQILEKSIRRLKHSSTRNRLIEYEFLEVDESISSNLRNERFEKVFRKNRKNNFLATITEGSLLYFKILGKNYKMEVVKLDTENKEITTEVFHYEFGRFFKFSFQEMQALSESEKIIIK